MKWGFSGTRFGRKDTFKILNGLLLEHGRSEVVIVGDAKGVDAQVRTWCKMKKIPFIEKCVNKATPSPERYWDRNQEIVEALLLSDSILFALPDENSTGTHDCANRAKKANIKVLYL